jgi:predicted SAM-dependent methyltransferase
MKNTIKQYIPKTIIMNQPIYYRFVRHIFNNSYSLYKLIKILCINMVNKLIVKKNLNVGGGSQFRQIGWINLDSSKSISNPSPFLLNPQCVFPINDNFMNIIYNSHNLEHLDKPTIDKTLTETNRVLNSSGSFIVKLPDFDRVLNSWKSGDKDFIYHQAWGNDFVPLTWKNKQIEDNIDYRTAMIFCGYWNDEYGDHYSNLKQKAIGAYHGPPQMDRSILKKLFQTNSPENIAKTLRSYVIDNEKIYHFNHQAAWSKMELESLLNKYGFNVLSFRAEKIIEQYKFINGIEYMKDISIYCLSEKA